MLFAEEWTCRVSELVDLNLKQFLAFETFVDENLERLLLRVFFRPDCPSVSPPHELRMPPEPRLAKYLELEVLHDCVPL